MMGNLPIGVPPPTMQGLLMQQQMMAAIPTTAASAFPPGTMLPPMSVSGGPNLRVCAEFSPDFRKSDFIWYYGL